MRSLRYGDRGHAVRMVQTALGVAADGVFGRQTEAVVVDLQRRYGRIPDGIVGPHTMDAVWESVGDDRRADRVYGAPTSRRVELRGVDLERYAGGANATSYRHLTLSAPTADAFEPLARYVEGLGGTVTTSGGRRSLSAKVGVNRSAFSRHYLGDAFDLGVYTGANDPASDPFIAEVDGHRAWRVWARVAPGAGQRITIRAVRRSGGPVKVSADVVDFTALAMAAGFEPIPCRASTWPSVERGAATIANPGGLEWWHFQRVRPDLVEGATLWGDALMGAYPHHVLHGSPPWAYRHAVFGEGWR